VRAFEEALYKHLDGPGRPVAKSVLDKKALDDQVKADIRKMLEAVKTDFKARAVAA
jgi:hypothetical protein